jgi:hypothetical protein
MLAYAQCGGGFQKKITLFYSDPEYRNAEYELLLRPQTPNNNGCACFDKCGDLLSP